MYPKITTSQPVVLIPAQTAEEFTVTRVIENLINRTVDAIILTNLGEYQINVLNESNYFPDWGDEDVENAVKAYLENK